MKIQKEQISDCNKKGLGSHNKNYEFLANQLSNRGHNIETIISKLAKFQVAIPSWAQEAHVLGVFLIMENLQI